MPIIWSRSFGSKGRVAVWHITESEDELYMQLQLNHDELKHYQSLQQGRRNMHWLGSRVLLRSLLNTTEYIDCQLDENNKPYLVNFPFEISISHSHDYAAVIIYEGKKVGVDVERIAEKVERIATRFLSKHELDFISEEHKRNQLYVCWGIKETLFKLYGKGNLPFIQGIQIAAFRYAEKGKARAKIVKVDYEQEFEIDFEKIQDYMLTYCIE